MNENEIRTLPASDDEVLAGVRRHMTNVEPLVPLPQTWQPDRSTRASQATDGRVKVRVRPAGAFSFGGVIAVLLVAVVVGAGLGHQGPFAGGAYTPPPSPTMPPITIVLELQAPNGRQPTAEELDTTATIMTDRVNATGAGRVVVTTRPPNRISVSVLGGDPQTLERLLGTIGKLEFVLLPPSVYGTADTPGTSAVPADGDMIAAGLTAQFDGSQLDPSKVAARNDATQGWVVDFAFNGTAAADFATWSSRNVGNFLAVVLDGKVVEVPIIAAPMTDGTGVLSGSMTAQSANELATILKYGSLPFPVRIVSSDEAPDASGQTFPAVTSLPGPVLPSATTPGDIPSSGRTLGNSNAPVTMDVWSDYQCPECRTLALQVLPRIIDSYVRQGQVKIVFHDLIHMDGNGSHESEDAANAARCAADQGKFAAYQDWLWANQLPANSGGFSLERLVNISVPAGLDTTTFQACVQQGSHLAEVRAEALIGAAMNSVPTVDVNSRFAGSTDYDELVAAVKATLAGASPSPSSSASN